MNIYSLKSELQNLMALSDEVGADAIRDTIDGMSGDITEIIDESVKYIKNIELLEKSAKEEAQRIKEREKRFSAIADSARSAVSRVIELSGKKSFTSALFTVTLAKGREKVDIFDQGCIPDEFMEVEVTEKPDKKRIAEAIKNGLDVPGAKIVVGENSLRIK